MSSTTDKTINTVKNLAENLSQQAEAEKKKVELTTKAELAPLGSKVEMDLLSKEITQDKKSVIDIEADFSSLSFDKIPTLPEEKKQFELFQKETFIFLHQLIGLEDTLISPEDLKLKAGGAFFDPAFQEHYVLSDKAKGLYGKLQSLYGYFLSGTDAQKQNAHLIFENWNTLIDQIQTGVQFAGKVKKNPDVLKKNEATLPPKEKNLWDKIVENKGTLLTTAAVGLGVFGAVKFISSLFGGKKEESKESGGFWGWLLGGGAVLGAVGLTFLSGKNPLEMVSSLFGKETLKVLVENSLKSVLGEDLTNLLVTKLDGKVTPEEFKEAFQKDGVKGIGKLILDKGVEFSEDEWKKISDKLGLPDFSKAKELWAKAKDAASGSTNNSTVSNSSETIDKSNWIPASEAMKNYRKNISDALFPLGTWLEKNKLSIAGVVLAVPAIRHLMLSATSSGMKFTANEALDLAKLDWATVKNLKLASLFSVSAYLLFTNVKIPQDATELGKYLTTKKTTISEWCVKQSLASPSEKELQTIATLLTGDPDIKSYFADADKLGKGFMKSVAERVLISSPEQLIKEKNLVGLRQLKNYLTQYQITNGQEKFKNVIEEVKTMLEKQEKGQMPTKADIEKLKTEIEAIDPLLILYVDDGYVRLMRKDLDGMVVEGPLNIAIDPSLDKKVAAQKAENFIAGYENSNKTELIGIALQKLMKMGGDMKNAATEGVDKEATLYQLITNAVKNKKMALICEGGELLLEGATEKLILGPMNLFGGLLAVLRNTITGKEGNYTQYWVDLANGAVPVTIFAVSTTLFKSVLDRRVKVQTRAKLLTNALAYPVTGLFSIEELFRKHMLMPLWHGEYHRILQNPRDRLSLWSKKQYNKTLSTLEGMYKWGGEKLDKKGSKIIGEIASRRYNISQLQDALLYITKAELQVPFLNRVYYDTAEQIIKNMTDADAARVKLGLEFTSKDHDKIVDFLKSQVEEEKRLITLLKQQGRIEDKPIAETEKAKGRQEAQTRVNEQKNAMVKPGDLQNPGEKIFDLKKTDFEHLSAVEKAEMMRIGIDDVIKYENYYEQETKKLVEESMTKNAHEKPSVQKSEIEKIIKKRVEELQQKKNPLCEMLLNEFKALPQDLKSKDLVEEFGHILKNHSSLTKITLIGKNKIAFTGLKAATLFVGIKSAEALTTMTVNAIQGKNIEKTPTQIFEEVFAGVGKWDIAQFAAEIAPLQIGNATSAYGAVMGKEMLTGKALSSSDRWSNALWAVSGVALDLVGMIPGPGTAVEGMKMYKRAMSLAARGGPVGHMAEMFVKRWDEITKIANKVGWERFGKELYAFVHTHQNAVKRTAQGGMAAAFVTPFVGSLNMTMLYEPEREVELDPLLVDHFKTQST